MVQINKNFLQWQIKKYLEFSADSITCQSINYSSRSFPISILLSTVCNSQCVTYCYEDPILYSLQYFVFLSWRKEKDQKSSMRVLLKLLFEQLCYISQGDWNSGLLTSRVNLTTWRDGASLTCIRQLFKWYCL